MDYDQLDIWDTEDELGHFRDRFHFPEKKGERAVYLCGNSLGLQPRSVKDFLDFELNAWRDKGVEGHFTGDKPWVSYHELAKKSLAGIVGAKPDEVQAIGSLTSNLHLLLASFYQPAGDRVKVIIESGAFPSDFYAVHSHMKMKGVDPEEHLIELKAKDGSDYLPNAEVISSIKEIGEELALVLMPGVQYYTGQFFDIGAITSVAHHVGAFAGFDHAHAIGNVPLDMHAHEVDFAVWCTYKYLNSGPGGIGGMFIHEKHASNREFPRLSGWWGHDAKERFEMANRINPIPTVDGWQLSNVNVLSSAAHLASLEIFDEAGMDKLRQKSVRMTSWLYAALEEFEEEIELITPKNMDERGCQLSLYLKKQGKEVFDRISQKGVICDWREPNVIRIAPVPLYNTFAELGKFVDTLKEALNG